MTELNDRQRTYLLAALEIDQRQQRFHKEAFGRGDFDESCRPAADWRAMPFGRRDDFEARPPTPLREACGGADEGSGATWAALARRRLVSVQDRPVHRSPCGLILPHVTLTPAGRRMALALKGEAPMPRAPGVLAYGTWRALSAAQRAGRAGLKDDQGGGWYGGIPWRTWLLLRNFRGGGLVEEFSRWVPQPQRLNPGHREREHFIRLSERGCTYYASKWAANRDAYPDIDAPDPSEVTDHA